MPPPAPVERAAVQQALLAQVAWCNRVGIHATPTLLLDGKPLPPGVTLEALRGWLRARLREAGPGRAAPSTAAPGAAGQGESSDSRRRS